MVSTSSFWSAKALRDAPAWSSSFVPTFRSVSFSAASWAAQQRRLLLQHPDVRHHLLMLLVGGRRGAARREEQNNRQDEPKRAFSRHDRDPRSPTSA